MKSSRQHGAGQPPHDLLGRLRVLAEQEALHRDDEVPLPSNVIPLPLRNVKKDEIVSFKVNSRTSQELTLLSQPLSDLSLYKIQA
ncbi:MAG: hypothetical protein AB7T49_12265 [Oligoflexales bacterium]